ncbi:hypothetical protein KUTG_02814 [Kutzneria sp. 744]|nr:hypothetical protein KUTG_02814 [Kutzneria sp. 744]
MALPTPLAPPAVPVEADITPWLGTYERSSVRMEVLDGPVLRTTVTGPLAKLLPQATTELPMTAVAPDLYVVRPPESQTWIPVTFYTLPDGARYVHHGVRATPKVG